MTDTVTLSVAGADVTIPAKTLTDLWLERVRMVSAAPVAAPLLGPPAIGARWGGGIYAGLVRGDPGARDYHLVVSESEITDANWEAAKTWAAEIDVAVQKRGDEWSLPKRREQAVLFGNVPELFAKEWYWSGETYTPDAAYAWAQDFYYGGQDFGPKGSEFRARAVRRLPL